MSVAFFDFCYNERKRGDNMYTNKVVVITGGASGIGAALVSAYADLNAIVYSFDVIAPEKCDKRVTYLNVDLAVPEQIETAFHQLTKKHNAVHVLINNGAIANFCKDIRNISVSEFKAVIDVNLIGAFACAKAFVTANEHQLYGRIINMSSTRYNQNEAGWEAYGASKGGIVSLTNTLAISLSETPITVNAISPGWIQTAHYDTLSSLDHHQHPSNRVGRVHDIVKACLYLTHPDNDFVNGHNLIVDGGMTKKMIYV